MSDRWWSRDEWDDTDAADAEGTHTCRRCDYAATIQTPQRRTRHYCRECEAFRPFVSTLSE